MRSFIVLFAMCVLFLGTTASADNHEKKGVLGDLLMQTEYVQKQIMSLQDAVPEEKYSWRPAEGSLHIE